MNTKGWIAVLEIAMEAIYRQDGGMAATETGWRNDELREAWIAIRREIERLEKQDES